MTRHSNENIMTNKNYGFTLIELMITVVIVAILAAIAYPSYTRYIARGHRAEAKAKILQLAQQLEQTYSNTGSYAGVMCSTSSACNVPDTGTSYFSVSQNASGSAYTITATATNSFTTAYPSDTCTTLTLSNTGAKGASSGSVDECWSK